MLGPPGLIDAEVGKARLDGLRPLPQFVFNDPQFGNFGHDPIRWRVEAGEPLARLRVFDHVQAVVDHEADISLVVEDAVLAGWVPVDRAGVPVPAGWGGDAIPVQSVRNGARADAGDELPIDAANRVGLFRVDPALPAHQLAPRVELPNHIVSVGQAGGDAAGHGAARLPAAHLLRQITQEQGVHRALEADVQFRNVAFLDGGEPDAGEPEPLMDGGGVFLIAGKPVQTLRHDCVELARLGIVQQAQGLGAVP
ncbi:hypothetical protein TSH58_05305 [Azospirillum sp. TSH58]|nr:hypothetical protein TSH58_05305 [Azospirillum sp. TSH58]